MSRIIIINTLCKQKKKKKKKWNILSGGWFIAMRLFHQGGSFPVLAVVYFPMSSMISSFEGILSNTLYFKATSDMGIRKAM